MLLSLINIQYCYDALINQIPVELIFYSHIPTALLALLFGSFLLYKSRKLTNVTLFAVCVFFALWCLLNLTSWFAFLGSSHTIFAWGLADLFSLTFFIFGYYFLYTFITGKDLPWWQKLIGLVAIAPTAWWTFWGLNLTAYDATTCEAWENTLSSNYHFGAQIFILVSTIILTIYRYVKSTDLQTKKETQLAGTGVILFFSFFFIAALLVKILGNYEAWASYAYNFEIYGLFGMPILLGYLGFLIVRYKAFDLRVFSVQALAIATVAIVAAQYAFLNDRTTAVLNSVNLLLVLIVSFYLVKNVKREIELRTQLEEANKRQQETLRFITHEVKGYLTDGAAAFDAILTNTYGAINDDMRGMLNEAMVKNRNAIREIQNFLRIADFKTGKVNYVRTQFDFKHDLESVLRPIEEHAIAKKLMFNKDIIPGDYSMVGDTDQLLNHVVGNLVNNSINYTKTGSVTVHLERKPASILFSVKDTGVGLTDDDKSVLFTEGGHGKDSRNVNPHSTGYGLYIASQIVLAHKGRIWAESEGRGKGAIFFVELPIDTAKVN